ncbi:MAG: SH3 domain-containing protein [Marinicaulis sp.]|nr:SH3 domain-containing protein [Marinicaulis sp.]NNE39870.1 SH3 domain-containing protein [Marinicaulis sp.]NNL88294.1 SH3 domain-containing protein [Marinicaulis sp.]
MSSLTKLTKLVIVLSFAAGCSTFSDLSRLGGNLGGEDQNYAAGSSLSGQLSGNDRDALADAFVVAMDEGFTQKWRGRRVGGTIEPGAYAISNLLAHPASLIDAVRADLDLSHKMETDLGLYVLTRNSNVRTGPGSENKIAEVLPSGTGVTVVGRVINKPWMLVSVNDSVRGYVFQDLLIKAPGTELELAGGPQRRPFLCRRFSQELVTMRDKEEWQGAACHDGAGWRLAPSEPQLVDDEELAGF